jgi:hypothetical protein
MPFSNPTVTYIRKYENLMKAGQMTVESINERRRQLILDTFVHAELRARYGRRGSQPVLI